MAAHAAARLSEGTTAVDVTAGCYPNKGGGRPQFRVIVALGGALSV